MASTVLGVVIAFRYSAINGEQHHVYDIENSEQHHAYSSENGFKIRIDSLEEEMWFVDTVIYGKVLEQGSTYQQNSNINKKIDFDFPVTPSTVLVNEVVISKVEEDKITLLQHGSLLEQNSASKLVSEGDEYPFFNGSTVGQILAL